MIHLICALSCEARPLPNCIGAFSFTPSAVAAALEHKTPAVARRIEALARLQNEGWQVGLRFDPFIHDAGFEKNYTALFRDIFPDEPLFASLQHNPEGITTGRNGMTAYRSDLESMLLDFCTQALMAHVAREKIHHCHTARV